MHPPIWIKLFICWLLFLAVDVIAGQSNSVAKDSSSSEQTKPSVNDSSETSESEPSSSALDTAQKSVADSVVATAKWLDSFFADPEYPNTDVDVRLNLRQYVIKQESLPFEYKTRIDGRIKLPNISRKLDLVFAGNEDEESGSDSFNEGLQSSDDNPTLGLELLNKRKPGNSERFKVGYRFGESSYYLGGRVRRAVSFAERWQLRGSQRLRWYHQFGWESQTLVELDYLQRQQSFFQLRLSTLWRDDRRDELGTETNWAVSYIYLRDNNQAWRLSWSSDYHTEPAPRWVASQIAVAYRRQIYREWLRFEVQPFVQWQEVNQWHPEYGISLQLNALIEQ